VRTLPSGGQRSIAQRGQGFSEGCRTLEHPAALRLRRQQQGVVDAGVAPAYTLQNGPVGAGFGCKGPDAGKHVVAGIGDEDSLHTRAQTPALLKGILFGPVGRAMTPTHTRKKERLYRYYVSTEVLKTSPAECPVRRVPAAQIEGAVIDQLRVILRTPEIVVGTCRALRDAEQPFPERDVAKALEEFDALWDELFPAEQARIVRLLVERVDVRPDGLTIRLRAEGLTCPYQELHPHE
jgi:hypothetical protein